jgi:hypothetical protein
MQNNSIRFACNGCGICCKGRLVPLTLNETRQWLERGHEVAIILEAFEQSIWTAGPQQFGHAAGRAVEVPCGNSHVRAVAVFAGNALVQCQSLGDLDGRGHRGFLTGYLETLAQCPGRVFIERLKLKNVFLQRNAQNISLPIRSHMLIAFLRMGLVSEMSLEPIWLRYAD